LVVPEIAITTKPYFWLTTTKTNTIKHSPGPVRQRGGEPERRECGLPRHPLLSEIKAIFSAGARRAALSGLAAILEFGSGEEARGITAFDRAGIPATQRCRVRWRRIWAWPRHRSWNLYSKVRTPPQLC
jgi:hypothetical protein